MPCSFRTRTPGCWSTTYWTRTTPPSCTSGNSASYYCTSELELGCWVLVAGRPGSWELSIHSGERMRGLALPHLGPAHRQPGIVEPTTGVQHLLLQYPQPVQLLLFGLACFGHRRVRLFRSAARVGDRLQAVLLCPGLRVAPSLFLDLRLAPCTVGLRQ